MLDLAHEVDNKSRFLGKMKILTLISYNVWLYWTSYPQPVESSLGVQKLCLL